MTAPKTFVMRAFSLKPALNGVIRVVPRPSGCGRWVGGCREPLALPLSLSASPSWGGLQTQDCVLATASTERVGSTCSRGVPRGIFGGTVWKRPGLWSESSQEEGLGSRRAVTVLSQSSRRPGARCHLSRSVISLIVTPLPHWAHLHAQTLPGSHVELEPSVTCCPPTRVPCSESAWTRRVGALVCVCC